MAGNSLPQDSRPPTEDSNPRLARLERSLEQLRGRVEEVRHTSQEGIMALRTELGSLLHRTRFAQSLERQPRGALRDSPRSTSVPSTRPQDAASEPGGALVQTTSGMEALEAFQTAGQQEPASAPDAAERILRAELRQEVGKLWEQLQQQGSSVQSNVTDFLRLEKAQQRLQGDLQEQTSKLASCKEDVGSLLAQQVELLRWSDVAKDSLRTEIRLECDRRFEELQRQNLEEREQLAAALAARVAAAENQLKDQASRSDFLHSLMQEEREQRGVETRALRWQLGEAGPFPPEAPGPGLLARLEALEDTCSDRSTSMQPFAPSSNGSAALRGPIAKLQQEFQQLRRDMDGLKAAAAIAPPAAVVSAQAAALDPPASGTASTPPRPVPSMQPLQAEIPRVIQELSARLAEAEGRLTRLEKLEDTRSDMTCSIKTFANLSNNGNEAVRNEEFQREMQQLRRDIQLLREEHSRLTEDTDRTPRPDPEFHTTPEQLKEVIGKVLEQQVRAAVEADLSDTPAGAPEHCSALSPLLAHVEASEASRCRALFKEVAALRERVKDLRPRSPGAELFPAEAAAAAGQPQPPGYRQLQVALADTSGDIASLARDLDRVRSERDSALPELTAKITAACMERIQERLTVEFAARRTEFAQDAGVQHEAPRKQLQALLQDAGAGCPRSGGAAGAAEAPGAGDVRRLHATLLGYAGQFEAMQLSLHDLRPRVMALEAVLAARVVAATSPSPTPQRPAHTSAVDTTEPRLPAAPAAASGPQTAAGGGAPGGGGGGEAALPARPRAQSPAASPQEPFRPLARMRSLPSLAKVLRSPSALSERRAGEKPGGLSCVPPPQARVYRATLAGGGGASEVFPTVHDTSEGFVGEESRAQPLRAMDGLRGRQSLARARGSGAALGPKPMGDDTVAPARRVPSGPGTGTGPAGHGALVSSQPQLLPGAGAPPQERELTGSERLLSPQVQARQPQLMPQLQTPQLQTRQLQQSSPLTPQQLQARPLTRPSDRPS